MVIIFQGYFFKKGGFCLPFFIFIANGAIMCYVLVKAVEKTNEGGLR